ncbi:MAG: DUF4105 domain-containing protein [Myxococcales bacterium]|nr:DUF4105 domain-containing protein [Myxococcales bacterium]
MKPNPWAIRPRLGGATGLALCAGLLWWAAGTTAQAQRVELGTDPEQLEIRLVTFGVGDQIVQYFGHNALWVRDRRARYSKLFNYGMFSFGRGMLPQYMQGRLTFWVAETPVQRSFEAYRRMGRDITVQELNLDPAARKRIVDRVTRDVLPKNRFYQYHHYYDNCSTRLRDVIDEAVGGQLQKAWSVPARFNYRGHTRRYSERVPAVNLALMFWMNDSMEEPIQRWHEAFLPPELEKGLDEFTYVNAAGERVPIVARRYTVFEGEQPVVPDAPSSMTGVGALLVGLLTGGIAVALGLGRRRRSAARGLRVLDGGYQALLGLVFGVPGLAGFLMATFTEHKVTHWNENLLLANPLTFALLPLGIAAACGSSRADRGLRACAYGLGIGAVLLLLLKVLPAFDQDNWIVMALLLPLDIGLAAGHWLRAHAGDARRAEEERAGVETSLSSGRSGA